jgi:GNAT superfamily N-acetyltransferase
MAWTIERLARQHDRTAFGCGKPTLDEFITRYATQYEKRNVGRTYVLLRDEPRVFGYYTLAAADVQLTDLPAEVAKRLPRHPVPVALLARLAVDQSVRGQGPGGLLLRDALTRVLSLSDLIGVFAVVVDAIDDEAVKFYQRFGFQQFPAQPNRLFLTVDTIRDSAGG